MTATVPTAELCIAGERRARDALNTSAGVVACAHERVAPGAQAVREY
jgi:hypothetical protein